MFACIYIPSFTIVAALRAEPELQAHPLAIFEGKPPLEKIIAVNERAAKFGIAPGITKAQAELCSDLMLRSRSTLQESSTHAALLDCAQSFSPCVEDAACDTALLDLRGMASLFGSVNKISVAIAERVIALGFEANVAVASNPDAALLAARGFPGITVIPETKEAETLALLPVEVLFSDRLEGDDANSLLQTLNRWGIHNLRALAALPAIPLSGRLGQQGLRLQQLARGVVSRTLVPVEALLVFEEAIELEHPIVLLEPLAFLLNRLLDQLCTRLGSRALATQELRLTLELESFSNQQFVLDSETANRNSKIVFTRTLSLPLPMLDPKVFLKLLQLDLNAHPPGAPILKIHLSAQPARSRSAQGGLFLPPSPEPEKLELTLARIAGIVGEQKVGALELLDTHHPEGFRMRRFVAEVARKAPQKKTPDGEEAQSAITALRRFRPPLRANVTLENGQPTRVSCAKKREIQGDVLWKAGPWRFSGDWWDREAWSRDEWDLALRNGEAVSFYRVVHDLLAGTWFLEGTYD
jgi:protein ImuB